LEVAWEKLLTVRNQREQPLRDVKILSGWNGLMIAALARGAALTGNKRWLQAARKATTFIHTSLTNSDGRLLRSWCGSPSTIAGFLEDYAFLGWGYLELYQAGSEPADLQRAEQLCRDALRLFRRADRGFNTAGNDTEKQLPLALIDSHDGVIPSGPAALAMNLVRLATLTKTEAWQQLAESTFNSLIPALQRQPVSGLWLLGAALRNKAR